MDFTKEEELKMPENEKELLDFLVNQLSQMNQELMLFQRKIRTLELVAHSVRKKDKILCKNAQKIKKNEVPPLTLKI